MMTMYIRKNKRYHNYGDTMKKITLEYTKKIFGKNLKYYRFLRKMTQETLGEKINRDTTYISDMERGKKGARFDTITDIANALDIKLYQLFDESILNKKIPNDIRNYYYRK